jgi:two-component system phosphate regulon sensor histidine kinase PhoR
MWTSRLFGKLFFAYVVLNVALAVVFLLLLSNWQRQQLVQRVEQTLRSTAVALRSQVEEPVARWSSLPAKITSASDDAPRLAIRQQLRKLADRLAEETSSRITLIASDGEVIADSEHEPATMDNHADRPEVVAAREQGEGRAERRSATLGGWMLYKAVAIDVPGPQPAVVRVSVSSDSIDAQVASTTWLLWGLAAAVMMIALGLTYVAMNRVLRPLSSLTKAAQDMAQGKFDRASVVRSNDEIGALSLAFREMQNEIMRRIELLEESNERMMTVLTSMSEGIIAVDDQEQILLANEAGHRMLEFSTTEPLGRQLLEVTRSRPVHEAVAEALRTGKAAHREFETTGQKRRALSLRAACFPGDPPPGVVVVLRDMSELRRLENLRRELVANVSHELKTPLASIKAYAETLRLGAVDDTENCLRFVGRIEDQADRLHQLIMDMLQIARVESGQKAFEISDVPLAEAVGACVANYEEVAAARPVEVKLCPSEAPLHVRVDEEGLQAILSNLIDNAIKYTPEGGSVTVKWWEEGDSAVLEVSDTGIGIAEEDQARVFERFFRVDKARSREMGGTGLGLSIVKHLTQSFGGTVGIESELGKGSAFRVELPKC